MFGIFIAIVAYFLNASATAIDKFLLSKKITNPAVYAFVISALSLLGIVLIPFGFHSSTWIQILIALANGIVFVFAYLYMFKAIGQNEVSRITPFMGGLQPIFIFALAGIFLKEVLPVQSLLAFLVIVIGTIVISWQKKGKTSSRRSYLLAAISAFLFAVAITLNKQVFNDQGFVTGFVWTRVGTFLGALLLLIPLKNRQDIIKEIRHPQKQSGWLFVGGQVCGALSFLLVSYSIAVSNSVALVSALRGLEYVFLLLIVLALSKKHPRLLSEKMTPRIIAQKAVATSLIIVGLIILFYQF
ncbi:MAG: EamA family transporter [bacterium]